MYIRIMQALGLERDDVIISPFAVIVTVSSYGTTLLLTVFSLWREQYNRSDWLKVTYAFISRQHQGLGIVVFQAVA